MSDTAEAKAEVVRRLRELADGLENGTLEFEEYSEENGLRTVHNGTRSAYVDGGSRTVTVKYFDPAGQRKGRQRLSRIFR